MDREFVFDIPADVYTTLSNSERYLLEYVYQNIEYISRMSIVTLSENANVSTATIVRLMKKIGYDGYTSFKYSLKEKLPLTDETNAMDTIQEKIKQAVEKNKDEVAKTIQMQNIGNIEDAVQKIHRANKIYIFARGFSEMIGQEMMVKLQLSGKNCEMHNDPNIIKIKSREIKRDELAMFISLSGETKELIEACKNLNLKKISTISLLTKIDSTLGELSEMTFVGYKGEHSYFPNYEVRSRLPLNVISRILLDAYVIRMLK
ncbi:MurR/RpiR family transcriptional regulator [Salibacterium salarium]|uniref:MurR/RpiR family transcriptional regulator n=1 Tax=Salibacterium salarium TaxID=284579 RepID=A0A3R9Q3X9_9BACI|nr:MurR/RpiR family transcriptional regulator [Salibacterium salarium]RSL33103.1 MurR/RpiR family transcriptional regulator [Salibacterium salarium]